MSGTNADDPLEIQGCHLDAPSVSAQRARYRRLAEDVTEITRTEATVVVSLRPSVGRELLAETLAVERDLSVLRLRRR